MKFKAFFKTLFLAPALLLTGCMLPRVLIAAFVPFQSFMIWGARVAARYGGPLVMLMFVDASEVEKPHMTPEGLAEPALICYESPRENLPEELIIIDYREVTPELLRDLASQAEASGKILAAAPLSAEPKTGQEEE